MWKTSSRQQRRYAGLETHDVLYGATAEMVRSEWDGGYGGVTIEMEQADDESPSSSISPNGVL